MFAEKCRIEWPEAREETFKILESSIGFEGDTRGKSSVRLKLCGWTKGGKGMWKLTLYDVWRCIRGRLRKWKLKHAKPVAALVAI